MTHWRLYFNRWSTTDLILLNGLVTALIFSIFFFVFYQFAEKTATPITSLDQTEGILLIEKE